MNNYELEAREMVQLLRALAALLEYWWLGSQHSHGGSLQPSVTLVCDLTHAQICTT